MNPSRFVGQAFSLLPPTVPGNPDIKWLEYKSPSVLLMSFLEVAQTYGTHHDATLLSVELWKSKSTASFHHEFVVATFTFRGIKNFLLAERLDSDQPVTEHVLTGSAFQQAKNDPNTEGPHVSLPQRSSSLAKLSFKKNSLARDMVMISRTQDKLDIESYEGHCECLGTVDLSHKNIPMEDVILILDIISKNTPNYDLSSTMCYYYAGMFLSLVQFVAGGSPRDLDPIKGAEFTCTENSSRTRARFGPFHAFKEESIDTTAKGLYPKWLSAKENYNDVELAGALETFNQNAGKDQAMVASLMERVAVSEERVAALEEQLKAFQLGCVEDSEMRAD